MRINKPLQRISLNVLLTNGRFPTSLDLARQLRLAGHRVYTVDCMHYHVCKFSVDVEHSYQVPVPRENPEGFVDAVKIVIKIAKIDLVIPMHEEIFYLAHAASLEDDSSPLRTKLFAPPFKELVRLHSKWEFSKFLERIELNGPESRLCKSHSDVEKLLEEKDITEWALKPVFGRASSHVFHLRPNESLPAPRTSENPAGLDVGEENHYVAQQWLYGPRYCSYSVLKRGRVVAFCVYPVQDTIDGSSCVYFQAVDHPKIRAFVDKLAEALPGISGQIALDFIELGSPYRLFAIECNPRATAGIHLFSKTSDLALAMTRPPLDVLTAAQDSGEDREEVAVAHPGTTRQLAPGMLMWKRRKADRNAGTALKQYLRHMKHLIFSRDVMFSKRDILPSLMEPFLLTAYYEMSRRRKMNLPTTFQYDLVWEPTGQLLKDVRKIFEEEEERATSRSGRVACTT